MTKVSIIVPIYNVEQYITECIESIMAQTYTEIECILVDDASPDKSLDIAKSLVKNYHGPISFQFIIHQKNSGPSKARNSGIKVSTGKFLFFIDSDDKIFPETIQKMIEMAKKYVGVEMVQGDVVIEGGIRKNLSKTNYYYQELYSNQRWIEKRILFRNIPPVVHNKLILKSLVIDNNLYFLEGIIHEDTCWLYDLSSCLKSIAFLHYQTYWYRQSNLNSIMNTLNINSLESILKIVLHGLPSSNNSYPRLWFLLNLIIWGCMAKENGRLARTNEFKHTYTEFLSKANKMPLRRLTHVYLKIFRININFGLNNRCIRRLLSLSTYVFKFLR